MRLPVIAVVSLISLACDEPSQPPVSDAKPSATSSPAEVAADESEGEAATTSEAPPSEAPPVEPPPPVGGPHCDQREAKQMCVDFTTHTGVTEVRCHEGAELREGACPSEAVIASCTLPSTGVTLRYYEGKSLDDARTACATIDGQFEAP